MTSRRQLRLGAFMRPVGIHTAWWRYPGGWPDANTDLSQTFDVDWVRVFAR